jgi:hypothetical protein
MASPRGFQVDIDLSAISEIDYAKYSFELIPCSKPTVIGPELQAEPSQVANGKCFVSNVLKRV